MNRRNLLSAVALALMVVVVGAVIARSLSGPPANRLLVAGDVRAVVRTISAPAISYPTISYSVQVPSNAAPGAHVAVLNETLISGGVSSRPSTRAAGGPVISGTVSSASVRVGDHVTTGQVLAQLDTKLLDLGVQQAKINATKTETSVRVLDNGIDTILDNIDKLVTARAALATGKAALAAGRLQLAKAKATLLAARAGLLDAQAARMKLEEALAGAKSPAEIARLEAALAKIPSLPTIAAGLDGVGAGLAQVAAGEAKLAAAAAQLAAGAAQLAAASSALHTAKTQAIKARDYVRIIAGGASVGVTLAEFKRDQATIVSPVSGLVTQAPTRGTTAIVGAPLVRIRPDATAVVDTYLAGEQLSAVHLGSVADITYDSGGGRVLHGTLETIGSEVVYPPTSFPTGIVHMTRTVKVTFRLDSGDAPPAGTPVDIAIHTD